jgi:hypothetical protein
LRHFATIFAVLLLSACNGCGTDPLNFAKSPDGKFDAIAFERRCLTTNVTTNVSIVEAGHNLPDMPGNVLTVGGEHPLSVEWQGSSGLIVHGDTGAKLSQFHGEIRHVHIRYTEQ